VADQTKQIIEINGVKLEVDMRYARRIEHIRVGDRVKVLGKDYSEHKVYPGVVIGFEPFEKLPTIVVAYVESTWNSTEIKFLHFNSQTKDREIVVSADPDFELDREKIVAAFERQRAAKLREVEELEERIRYFQTNFKAYWQRFEAPAAASE